MPLLRGRKPKDLQDLLLCAAARGHDAKECLKAGTVRGGESGLLIVPLLLLLRRRDYRSTSPRFTCDIAAMGLRREIKLPPKKGG